MTLASDYIDKYLTIQARGFITGSFFKGYKEEYIVIEGKLNGKNVKYVSDLPEIDARSDFFNTYVDATISEIFSIKRVLDFESKIPKYDIIRLDNEV